MTWCLVECVETWNVSFCLRIRQKHLNNGFLLNWRQFLFEDTNMHSHVNEQEVFSCFYRCSQWGMYRKGCGVGYLLGVWQRPSTLTISKAFRSKAFGIATCLGHKTRKLIWHHYNGKLFNMSGVLATMILSAIRAEYWHRFHKSIKIHTVKKLPLYIFKYNQLN